MPSLPRGLIEVNYQCLHGPSRDVRQVPAASPELDGTRGRLSGRPVLEVLQLRQRPAAERGVGECDVDLARLAGARESDRVGEDLRRPTELLLDLLAKHPA